MSLPPHFFVVTLFRVTSDLSPSAKLPISKLVTEIRHFFSFLLSYNHSARSPFRQRPSSGLISLNCYERGTKNGQGSGEADISY